MKYENYQHVIGFNLGGMHALYLGLNAVEYQDLLTRCYNINDQPDAFLAEMVRLELAEACISHFAASNLAINLLPLTHADLSVNFDELKYAGSVTANFKHQQLKLKFYAQNPDLPDLQGLFNHGPALPKLSGLNIDYILEGYNLKNSVFKKHLLNKTDEYYLALTFSYGGTSGNKVFLHNLLLRNIVSLALGDSPLKIEYNDFYANLIIDVVYGLLPDNIRHEVIVDGYQFNRLNPGYYEQVNCWSESKLLGYMLIKQMNFPVNNLSQAWHNSSPESLVKTDLKLNLPLIAGSVEISSKDFAGLAVGDIICFDYPLNYEKRLTGCQLGVGSTVYPLSIKNEVYTICGANLT